MAFPSTYAAQIVDNIESVKTKTQLTSSAPHLKDLLQRILEADRRGIFQDGAFDSNLEVNHKLICVIVRACLVFPKPLSSSDDQHDAFEQAKDCLAVIQLTIRKFPEVLYVLLQDEDTYTRPDGPLFLWLIPHLLSLLHFRIERDVRDGAKQVLETMLAVKKTPVTLKSKPLPVHGFIQGCIHGNK